MNRKLKPRPLRVVWRNGWTVGCLKGPVQCVTGRSYIVPSNMTRCKDSNIEINVLGSSKKGAVLISIALFVLLSFGLRSRALVVGRVTHLRL